MIYQAKTNVLSHKLFPKFLLMALLLAGIFAFSASADIARASGPEITRFNGGGYLDVDDECDSAGMGADFALIFNGDLDGCLYTFVETGVCSPDGSYVETGTEIFVGTDWNGDEGTFGTTYTFYAKYEDCPSFSGQIYGKCYHPIVYGTGTGAFEGTRGRFNIQDDVENGTVAYKGVLQYKN
jgi:hypothetical protein